MHQRIDIIYEGNHSFHDLTISWRGNFFLSLCHGVQCYMRTICDPHDNDKDLIQSLLPPHLTSLSSPNKRSSASFRIEMDANSKLGTKYIPKDKHKITPNGKLLAGIVERQHLIIANGSTKCKGAITRKRVLKNNTEESSIDIVLFSEDLKDFFVSMEIDEERKHVLKKVKKTKKGLKVKHSDHNVLFTEFNLRLKEMEKETLESYNLGNKECQEKFKEYTTNTKMLSSIFEDKYIDINTLTNRFLKKIDGSISQNFRKYRRNPKEKDEEEKLFMKLSLLEEKNDEQSKKEKMSVLQEISKNC